MEDVITVLENNCVLVRYEESYHVGQVIRMNGGANNNSLLTLNCMQQSNKLRHFRNAQDEVWYKENDILKIIHPT